MRDKSPLTKADLIAALKEIVVATPSYLTNSKGRLKDHVHEQMSEFFEAIIKPELHEANQEMNTHFGIVESRLAQVKDKSRA
jgi:hypothetical protein